MPPTPTRPATGLSRHWPQSGHLRQSAPLWQQIASLLAQEPRSGGDRMARAWLLAAGWANQGEFTKAVDLLDEVLPDGRPVERLTRLAGPAWDSQYPSFPDADDQSRSYRTGPPRRGDSAPAPCRIGMPGTYVGGASPRADHCQRPSGNPPGSATCLDRPASAEKTTDE